MPILAKTFRPLNACDVFVWQSLLLSMLLLRVVGVRAVFTGTGAKFLEMSACGCVAVSVPIMLVVALAVALAVGVAVALAVALAVVALPTL